MAGRADLHRLATWALMARLRQPWPTRRFAAAPPSPLPTRLQRPIIQHAPAAEAAKPRILLIELHGRRRLMREINFLPSWYSQFLQRRRTVFLQTCLTLLVALGFGLWLFLADRNERAAEGVLDSLKGQVQQTSAQLTQMDRLEMLRKQLRGQAEV